MRGLLIIAAGLVPACTSGLYETSVVESEQGACTKLEGRTFVSIDELECGVTQRCRWQLAFDVDAAATSQFMWFYSDVAEVGQVSCVGGKVTATTASRTLRATFDPATLQLSWAGVTYVAQ